MRNLSPREAHRAWRAGELAIVDCREEVEYELTRIPGVPLVPMSELAMRVDDLPDDRPLAIVCRSGARSGQVAEWLTADGRRGEVANLEGGMLAWAADGLDYEGEPPR
jgi:rhodanese-related sulfurtransferase